MLDDALCLWHTWLSGMSNTQEHEHVHAHTSTVIVLLCLLSLVPNAHVLVNPMEAN